MWRKYFNSVNETLNFAIAARVAGLLQQRFLTLIWAFEEHPDRWLRFSWMRHRALTLRD
jgi:hypothetical protein